MYFFQASQKVIFAMPIGAEKTWPRGYKSFFMLNSVEQNFKRYQEFQLFLGSGEPRILFVPLINVKLPIIVGILIFMGRKNFMLS